MKRHIVKQGECLWSIAERYKLLPDTIWLHSDNAALKRERGSKEILAPGDVLSIPDKDVTQKSAASDKRHRFRRKGIPAKVRVKVLMQGKVRTNAPWTAEIDGEKLQGTTDAEGIVEFPIPTTVASVTITVGPPDSQQTFSLKTGYVDPIDTPSGLRIRLCNLGFRCPAVDNEEDAGFVEAVKLFQQQINHPRKDGVADEGTRQEILKRHGC